MKVSNILFHDPAVTKMGMYTLPQKQKKSKIDNTVEQEPILFKVCQKHAYMT